MTAPQPGHFVANCDTIFEQFGQAHIVASSPARSR
jgi:hypothetical protein